MRFRKELTSLFREKNDENYKHKQQFFSIVEMYHEIVTDNDKWYVSIKNNDSIKLEITMVS